MTTVGEDVVYSREHSHAPDARKLHIRSVVNKMKHCGANSTEPPRRIIRAVTTTIDQASAVELPSNESLSRTIRRIRNRNGLPKEPKTLAELILADEHTITFGRQVRSV